MLDLPPLIQERVICSIEAAIRYQVPANIVLAVAEMENGKPGQHRQNENGTQDIGVMQINTRYLSDLAAYGITASDVADKGCYPYALATWRLRGHLRNDQGDIWTRAANYHSRTPLLNARYCAKLKTLAIGWGHWLRQHYQTRVLRPYEPAKEDPDE